MPVELEVADDGVDDALAARIAGAVRSKLTFRCDIRLMSPREFGAVGYKTRATIRRVSS